MPILSRLVRVVPLAVLVAVAVWRLTQNDDDRCGTIGGCLGSAADQLVLLVVLAPAAWLVLRLLRTPAATAHVLVTVVLGGVAWFGTDALLTARDPGRLDSAALPLLAAVLLAALAGVAGVLVVAPGSSPRDLLRRVGVPLAFAGSWAAADAAADHALDEERVADIAATGLTTYAPVLDGAHPVGAYPSPDGVRLSYRIDEGASTSYETVRLLPAPPGSLCEAVLPYVDRGCVEDGGTMRRIAADSFDVAVVRGDTMLVATSVRADTLDPSGVVAALADAQEVPVEKLAH